ncbi:MAG: O-methyltransferase [Acidimicrobiales bacterium]
MNIPDGVRTLMRQAQESGFELSCHEEVGALLAVLAAGVRPNGAILELGTGTGVGLGWVVSGLGARDDVQVVSVELDQAVGEVVAQFDWPFFVELEIGDALEVLKRGRRWDLIFADAQGGKWEGLDDTIAALASGGLLLVDDMTPAKFVSDQHRDKTSEVRSRLLANHQLVSVELNWASGLILCARRCYAS